MIEELENSVDYDALRRQVRLLMLLNGAERAGIVPIRLHHLHIYAYLSNVLAPVWESRVFEGHLLKRRAGPFYPALQHDLDQLIGRGMVLIREVRHYEDVDRQWRLDGALSLNHELSDGVLEAIDTFARLREIQSFLQEIAYAVSSLSDSEFDVVPGKDPTYSDSSFAYDNVVEFSKWSDLNYSVNAARNFKSLSESVTPGELLHLFVRHLHRRING